MHKTVPFVCPGKDGKSVIVNATIEEQEEGITIKIPCIDSLKEVLKIKGGN